MIRIQVVIAMVNEMHLWQSGVGPEVGLLMEDPVVAAELKAEYKEAGDFPGAEGFLTRKEIITRLYKAVTPVLTPML
jgi:hypothetical protein